MLVTTGLRRGEALGLRWRDLDLARGKATYPSVIGLEASKQKARELIDGALAWLAALPVEGAVLEGIARYILTRVH